MERKLIPILFIVFFFLCSSCSRITVLSPHDKNDGGQLINSDYGKGSDLQDEAASFPVVDSSQGKCFDDLVEITCPEGGDGFFGQDAQYVGIQPSYLDNGDGTVTDVNTGLMWVQDAGEKVEYYPGVALAEDFEMAGYTDWRFPTIKELYSLMDFSGIDDADAGTDPFIDTDFFLFEYGDTSRGERAIDSQWMTNSIYVDEVMNGQECFFGVNFADGRIKCYPTRAGKGYFIRLVRGEAYGENNFWENGDGTVTDKATGLTWMEADSGEGMDWESALSFCEDYELNGLNDWRLPNAKELQSIVDYTRGPDTTSSAAIDPVFQTSSIINEAGEKDYPFFWTSTTHENRMGGSMAVYLSFGRAVGQMQDQVMDVHGAGAQRSDPKSGDISDFPTYVGPQGDVRRLNNYTRCVRGGVDDEVLTGGASTDSDHQESFPVANTPPSQNQRVGEPPFDPAIVADLLGVSESILREALGEPGQGPPDHKAAAEILEISEFELMEAIRAAGGVRDE